MGGYLSPYQTRSEVLSGGEDIDAYPSTHQGWVDRYQELIDAYHGVTYSQAQIKRMQLFRALDDSGKVIALTRRIHRDLQFIVNTGAAALAPEDLTLHQAEGASDEDYARAKAIWDRSEPDAAGAVWALLLVCCGDLHIEPARAVAGRPEVSLVHYPPQNVYVEYDLATARRLTKAVITSAVVGEAEIDSYGNVVEAPATYTHQRTLTETEIQVVAVLPPTAEGQAQSELDADSSGVHGLGRCPLVHIRCQPTIYPEHSLPVAHAIERGLAEIDSMISQMSAVGDRFANPKPYLFGAKLGDDTALSRFGRWLNVYGANAEKVKAGYLEPTMSGMTALQESLERMIRDIRLTFPEFLFVGGGSTAGLSGDALRMLATRYESKYRAIRKRFYSGLARALAIGVAMESLSEYDPGKPVVRIEGPPLLPADLKAELEALSLAKSVGGITNVDIVRRTQALGLADRDISAEDYAQLVAEQEMGRASMLLGDIDDPIDGDPLPVDADLAATAMNGAQVGSLVGVLELIATGSLTDEAAVLLITNSYPTILADDARQIVAGVIRKAAPPAPSTPPATPAAPVGDAGADGFPLFDEDEAG
jgi:hypothetical protein